MIIGGRLEGDWATPKPGYTIARFGEDRQAWSRSALKPCGTQANRGSEQPNGGVGDTHLSYLTQEKTIPYLESQSLLQGVG